MFIIRALKDLGTLKTECDMSAFPQPKDFDAEKYYLSWVFELTTAKSLADIKEVFEFVEFESDIEITPVETAKKAEAKDEGGKEAGGEKQQKGLSSQTIRVDLDKIDAVVNLVGEMAITQAMLTERISSVQSGQMLDIIESFATLSGHMRMLQESVMHMRAQPIRHAFTRMPRIVRDIAFTLGKEVKVRMEGEDTEVDMTITEKLIDPLTHMVRNAVDHGIETPEQRRKAGKSEEATITLSAQYRSGRIVIEVIDDGAGIDPARVLKKAIEKGVVAKDAALSDLEIINLIFHPGFSTKEQVSSVSGRGVGMDVVRQNVISMGGRVTVHSTLGKGTRISMSLPLTLAVMDGMVVSVGHERFVIPIANIIESSRPTRDLIKSVVNQSDVMRARGEYVRMMYLFNQFEIGGAQTDPTKGLVILVENDEGEHLAVVVDDILGQQQVVIKSIESNYKRMQGISAATILGDGRVAMILDVPELCEMAAAKNRLMNDNNGADMSAANEQGEKKSA